MSLLHMTRNTRRSTIRVYDKDRIIKLVRLYASLEKINDDAKAATRLLTLGFSAWASGKLENMPAEEAYTKYYSLSMALTETLRVLVAFLENQAKLIKDEDPDTAQALLAHAKYARQVLDTAIIETSGV